MNLSSSEMISHRKMNLNDLFLIYNWRNEKEVVNQSLSKKKITFNEHKTWFNQIMNSTKHLCLIFSFNGEEFGLVRFFLYNNSAEINYLICEKFRGKRLSKLMLIQSIKLLLSRHEIKKIFAKVLRNNIISSKILEDINFEQLDIKDDYTNYILKTK